jgi:hypothetical protein
MNETTRRRLQHAYELIKLKDFGAARPLVVKSLNEDKSNIDAWWLAVYTAKDPEEKRRAVAQVLRLNPTHEAALVLQNRLDEREAQAAAEPVPTTVIYSSRPETFRKVEKKDRSFGCFMQLVGILCLSFAAFVIVNNFFGGSYVGQLERLIGGEPEALGWISEEEGGLREADIEQGIPITRETSINDMGSPKFDVLFEGEAHTYSFYASLGAELLIAANFTSRGSSDVAVLELWDASGKVVAREQKLSEMMGESGDMIEQQFNGTLTIHAINYTVTHAGSYTVALVGYDGAPRGNYTLMVMDANEPIETDIDQYNIQ